jgi:hypothetical protein
MGQGVTFQKTAIPVVAELKLNKSQRENVGEVKYF